MDSTVFAALIVYGRPKAREKERAAEALDDLVK